MNKRLCDLVSIVIPCKNEENYIWKLLSDISLQKGIDGLHVYVADGNSTDSTLNILEKIRAIKKINLEVLDGGSVSKGRNVGLAHVKTPYVIFIDADVRIPNKDHILKTVKLLEKKQLVGAIISCDGSILSKFFYSSFNFLNRIISLFRPFAVGSFFAVHTDIIRKLGGWDESLVHSEDWALSSKFWPSNFAFHEYKVIVDDRRFKRTGYLGMIKIMFLSMIFGKRYQKKDNGYWNF
jgi:glycosyltransferase involved in cell wall biosynthesis